MLEQGFFVLFATLAVFCALMVISLRNALSSAFFLVLTFVNLAGLFVLLHAHFLAAAQILVYAGAIVVLFIFVIMLLNIAPERFGFLEREWSQLPGMLIGLLSLGALVRVVSTRIDVPGVANLPDDFGSLAGVAQLMFTKYLVPFELASILLLAATVGVVVLAKRVI